MGRRLKRQRRASLTPLDIDMEITPHLDTNSRLASLATKLQWTPMQLWSWIKSSPVLALLKFWRRTAYSRLNDNVVRWKLGAV